MPYDYRGARDWVYGIIREGERVTGYANTGATITERAVLLALVEFAPNIEPSTTALATMLGTSERAIRRLLRACEEKGFLTVELRPGQRSRYYLACDPGLKVPPDPQEPRTQSPPTPDLESGPPRTQGPPKQTSKADKKADNGSASDDAVTFALKSPAPKPRATNGSQPRGKGSKRKVERTPADLAAYNQLKDLYFEVYGACVGRKPPFDSKEGAAVWKLYDAVGLEQGECCLRNAFGDDWGKVRSILTVAADPAKFMAPAPRKTNGRAAPQQTDSDSVRAVIVANQGNFQ